jgi:hypothetical protein
LNEGRVHRALFEQAEIIDGTGRLDQFHFDALLFQQALVTFGIGVIGAARRACRKADRLGRRRVHQGQGKNETENRQRDQWPIDFPEILARHVLSPSVRPAPVQSLEGAG